jgi:hypothetical protein
MRDVPRGDNRTPINNGVCVDDVKTMRGNRLSAKQGNGKVNREARKHFVYRVSGDRCCKNERAYACEMTFADAFIRAAIKTAMSIIKFAFASVVAFYLSPARCVRKREMQPSGDPIGSEKHARVCFRSGPTSIYSILSRYSPKAKVRNELCPPTAFFHLFSIPYVSISFPLPL